MTAHRTVTLLRPQVLNLIIFIEATIESYQ